MCSTAAACVSESCFTIVTRHSSARMEIISALLSSQAAIPGYGPVPVLKTSPFAPDWRGGDRARETMARSGNQD